MTKRQVPKDSRVVCDGDGQDPETKWAGPWMTADRAAQHLESLASTPKHACSWPHRIETRDVPGDLTGPTTATKLGP